jgi:hypothetical protein
MNSHHQHHAFHTDAIAEKEYQMTFKTEPSIIEAGKPSKLLFKPVEVGNERSIVLLENDHEVKMHLFIISKDLSNFIHEHPEYTPEGNYIFEHTFPFGGEYYLFQDYTPMGSNHQLGRQTINVSGQGRSLTNLGEENLVWEGLGYRASLSSENGFNVKSSLPLKASILKDGKPVADLDEYLGALAHVVIVSEDVKEFVHVHPLGSKTNGPDILLHTNLPKEGKYKVYMQFKHQGKVQTASFVMDAK